MSKSPFLDDKRTRVSADTSDDQDQGRGRRWDHQIVREKLPDAGVERVVLCEPGHEGNAELPQKHADYGHEGSLASPTS